MSSLVGSDRTLAAINQLAAQREERRRAAEEFKKRRASEARELLEKGKFGDSDFVGMIERFRASHQAIQHKRPYTPGEGRINVAVRKRPVSERELALSDYDTVSCANPYVIVHSCKTRVDGITKQLENTQFQFDFAFDENSTNDEVYAATCLPLVEFVALDDGRSTVFAYGQTGSGKTFTMQGLQQRVARDIFRFARSRASKNTFVRVKCSNFELYGSHCLDLLNDRRQCAVREDGQGEMHIDGLKEEEAADEDEFLEILQRGSSVRTTRSTEMNADSSRSHAIFQVVLSTGGKLSLIDLAGSERGQDVKNHDHTRRVESSNINKSLLALKECIRALDPASGAVHVPYRQSKLTMVLKDSFASDSRTVMISCVSPAASSSDHTLNTLRYADRVKAKGMTTAGQQLRSEPLVIHSTLKSPGVGLASRKSIAPGVNSRTASNLRAKSPGLLGNNKPSGISPQRKGQVPRAVTNNVKIGTRTSPRASNATARSNMLDISMYSTASTARSELNYSRASLGGLSQNGDDDEFIGSEEENSRDDEENYLPVSSRRTLPVQADTPPTHGPAKYQTASQSERPASAKRASGLSVSSTAPVVPMQTPESVYALLDEEEALLESYSQAVQQNFRIIAEESNLLTEIESNVDYDIEVYTEKLRVLLEQKLRLFGDIHTKLLVFQDHLKLEEQYAVGALKREN